ncbi:hypothetical protein A7Q10_02465 [Methylacidiphilum caldifontis]|uniref:Uncharacterized protein n=1 Tax=Methylacidiphilum caldifontis TaxID=2795386 RepID=A0A4Y8P811_9BACT|nr:hypothetical protein A7Q10_02465 [Methylacidiphilum caldifontis]
MTCRSLYIPVVGSTRWDIIQLAVFLFFTSAGGTHRLADFRDLFLDFELILLGTPIVFPIV